MVKFGKIIFIQYGDYRHAFNNLESGGREQYYAQSHSMKYVESLTKLFDEVIVLCLATDYSYETLINGVGVIGMNRSKHSLGRIEGFVDSLSVSHIVLRTPIVKLIKYAIKNEIEVLPIIADSFSNKGMRNRINNFLLAKVLNNKAIFFTANHSLNSCLSLADIGVCKNKIIPWDWPHNIHPNDFLVKTKSASNPSLFYAGQMTKEKGLYDLIDAVEEINKTRPVILKVAGNDKDGKVKKYILGKGLNDQVILLGLVPQSKVVAGMVDADIVIVPSWHEYPEGLPMTIYEGLASRTPLIISDHPMFINKVVNGVSGLVFEAGSVESLVSKCLMLLDDDKLYHQISGNSLQAWSALEIKAEWFELVDNFINHDLSSIDIKNKSLASYEDAHV